MTNDIANALAQAEQQLALAGVPSPRVDAELLVAHVLGVGRSQLRSADFLTPEQSARFSECVTHRAARVPVQHLTGEVGFRYLTLQVGPGVFVPRPETEMLVEWGLGVVRSIPDPLVVDLCAGSGAIALSVAHEAPHAQVHAVESDELALAWLERNAHIRASFGDPQITVHGADATDQKVLSGSVGRIDLILCNPPYVPLGSVVAPEAGDYDPAPALWGGMDGLAVIRGVVRNAATLLRPGGWFGVEHAEQQAHRVAALLRSGGWSEVESLQDLTNRPRFTVGRRPS